MATSTQTIRRLTIEGRTTGVREATAELTALGRAQTTVAQSAEGMAIQTDASAKRQLSAARSYDGVRQRVDEVYRAQVQQTKMQATVQRAFDQGAISAEEFGRTSAMVSQHFAKSSSAANDNARSLGLARHEMINLSRQAQDVAVSLQGGQGIGTVLLQQGSQIADVFASSQGTVRGFFGQIVSGLGSIVTPARLAFGGIVAGAGSAIFALSQFASEQQRIAMQLSGAGRASGLTVSGVNAIANSSSSLTGLSVSEARSFAAELASSGRVGAQSIAPLVKMGHDVAVAFGVDAAEAAKMLGKAFADPVAGAETLNQRLGFLDATMKNQIRTLVEQNKVWEAQKLLQSGVASGLQDVSANVATSTRFWTGLGNILSNIWDSFGSGMSRLTGIGLQLGQLEKIQEMQRTIAETRQRMSTRSDAVNTYTGDIKKLAEQEAALKSYMATATRAGEATLEMQQRQRSFAQDATMKAILPDVGQIAAFRNQVVTLEAAIEDTQRAIANLVPDEATGARLKQLAEDMGRFTRALDVAKANVRDFRTEYAGSMESLKIAGDALTAFSPSARANIAKQESLRATERSGYTPIERDNLAAKAAENAYRSMTVAMTEAARSRDLYARQSIDSARIEIDLIGKTIGQQTEMRAQLQARQQIEQELDRMHMKWGPQQDAELARLKEKHRLQGEIAQQAAVAAVNDNIRFGRQTALLAPEDVQIAQQLKAIYPDVATALNSVEAAGLRTNMALSGLTSSLSGTLTTGLTDMLDGTKSVKDGFADMSKVVIRAIQEMVVKMLVVAPIMRGLQSMMSGFTGGFGGTTSLPVASARGNVFDGGNVIAFAKGGIVDRATTAPMALFGEAGPEAIMPLRRGADGKLGVQAAGGGRSVVNVTVINQTGTAAKAETSVGQNGDVTVTLRKAVEAIGVESITSGDMGRAIAGTFGAKKFAGQ